MKRVVAILDTMWGETEGTAAPFFRINPNNHSGRRLYRLIGNNHLLVTDACKELVNHHTKHGKPNPEWLAGNLKRIEKFYQIQLLLVCGSVAQKTYAATSYVLKDPKATVIEIPHPAARNWTTDKLEKTARRIWWKLQ